VHAREVREPAAPGALQLRDQSALAVCATLASRAVPQVARTRVRTAIRDRERRTAFLPQRDPDASGRPRPRAPGALVPTAA
ncbi:DUF6412 domain-containing protein, partial [Streptomyces violascens]|uniref:DUF6412 domain-containing protein n=1 Tax=Streptomyces violascens TaxID=67381 RepID=UPI0036B41C8A